MRKYTICTGNSRLADVWPATEITFEELLDRLKTPLRTAETVAQYKKFIIRSSIFLFLLLIVIL